MKIEKLDLTSFQNFFLPFFYQPENAMGNSIDLSSVENVQMRTSFYLML